MTNKSIDQTAERTAQRAVVSYYPEDMDDDSRVWHIAGNAGGDALVHIDIGPSITFALNDPGRAVGASVEYRPHQGETRDLEVDRIILAELFGDQAAELIGRSPERWGEGVEIVDDYHGIAEKEVSVEVKNPELARILGGLATIDFIRRERRSTYTFSEEKKQEMIRRAEELSGAGTHEFDDLIKLHERIQAAEDRFFIQNPVLGEDELTTEEDRLHAQLVEWLPLYGLQSWIDYRKRTANNR